MFIIVCGGWLVVVGGGDGGARPKDTTGEHRGQFPRTVLAQCRGFKATPVGEII